MGYVNRNLLQGEVVVYRARLHRIIFALPAALAAAGLLVASYLAWYMGSWETPSWVITAIFLVLALIVAFPRLVRYFTSEFAVTTKRVIVKVGLFHRHTLELVLAKVETVGVDQSIPGRLFNYGTIIVTGTGGTQEPFKDIADPISFRKQVQFELSSGSGPAESV